MAIVNAIIPVDQKIINHFEQYEKVTGLRYSRPNSLIINHTNITELKNNIWEVNNPTDIQLNNKRLRDLKTKRIKELDL